MRLYFAVILLLFSIQSFSQTKETPDTTIETSLTSDVVNKIIDDSKNGGSLDFWTPIKGHEYDGSSLFGSAGGKGNIYASNKELAVIKWSFTLAKRGIGKDDIIALFGLLKGRKVTSNDSTLIDIGIKKAAG
jgi:hypothetical protein